MMKKLFLLLSVSLFLTGCNTAFRDARQMILDGEADCVILNHGKIIHHRKGRGISPLMMIYRGCQHGILEDSTIVDKVIGRAAAAIAINGKAKHVHGEVMSEDAAQFLKRHGITASHTLLVPKILNRKRDGLCPMEQTVQGIEDPEKAFEALKHKISSFRKQ